MLKFFLVSLHSEFLESPIFTLPAFKRTKFSSGILMYIILNIFDYGSGICDINTTSDIVF